MAYFAHFGPFLSHTRSTFFLTTPYVLCPLSFPTRLSTQPARRQAGVPRGKLTRPGNRAYSIGGGAPSNREQRRVTHRLFTTSKKQRNRRVSSTGLAMPCSLPARGLSLLPGAKMDRCRKSSPAVEIAHNRPVPTRKKSHVTYHYGDDGHLVPSPTYFPHLLQSQRTI